MNSDPAAFTGSIPENYEKYMGPLLFEPYAQDLAERINIFGINAVLELACGTGRVTKHLRNIFPASTELIATDLNEAMLDVAKKTIDNEGITFQVVDAQELPFDDNCVGLVVCQFGFMFFPDKAKAFSEAYRVLKPGGYLLFNTWDKLENNQLVNTAKTIVTKFFDNDPPVFYQVPFSMHDENNIQKLMEDAGFKNIEIIKVTKEGRSPTSQDAVKGLITGNPISKEITDKDPAALEKISEQVEKEIIKRFGSKPVVTELNALVCKGSK
ncbi:MAG: class I SAM-dependent methyltransferase [Ignavibacteria bacterium]